MSDVSKVIGAGAEIEFEGRQWTMAPLTYELQAKFEAFLLRRAVEGVRMQRDYVTREEYDLKMDRVDRNQAAGVYGFGGAVCVDASKSLMGLKELVRLGLAKNHPVEVDHEFIDRLFASKQEEAAKTLNQLNNDPLPKTSPAPAVG